MVKNTKKSNEEQRYQRLAKLFEDSDPNEDLTEVKMDNLAANEGLNKFLKKVDQHLDLEKALINDWGSKIN